MPVHLHRALIGRPRASGVVLRARDVAETGGRLGVSGVLVEGGREEGVGALVVPAAHRRVGLRDERLRVTEHATAAAATTTGPLARKVVHVDDGPARDGRDAAVGLRGRLVHERLQRREERMRAREEPEALELRLRRAAIAAAGERIHERRASTAGVALGLGGDAEALDDGLVERLGLREVQRCEHVGRLGLLRVLDDLGHEAARLLAFARDAKRVHLDAHGRSVVGRGGERGVGEGLGLGGELRPAALRVLAGVLRGQTKLEPGDVRADGGETREIEQDARILLGDDARLVEALLRRLEVPVVERALAGAKELLRPRIEGGARGGGREARHVPLADDDAADADAHDEHRRDDPPAYAPCGALARKGRVDLPSETRARRHGELTDVVVGRKSLARAIAIHESSRRQRGRHVGRPAGALGRRLQHHGRLLAKARAVAANRDRGLVAGLHRLRGRGGDRHDRRRHDAVGPDVGGGGELGRRGRRNCAALGRPERVGRAGGGRDGSGRGRRDARRLRRGRSGGRLKAHRCLAAGGRRRRDADLRGRAGVLRSAAAGRRRR